jgi:hypothetical protein
MLVVSEEASETAAYTVQSIVLDLWKRGDITEIRA